MSEFVVRRSMRVARRTVLTAFLGAALVIATLLVERLVFQRTFEDAAAAARRALHLSDTILLADERLTMSANMAAATGEAAGSSATRRTFRSSTRRSAPPSRSPRPRRRGASTPKRAWPTTFSSGWSAKPSHL
jgi:hypothetical protein